MADQNIKENPAKKFSNRVDQVYYSKSCLLKILDVRTDRVDHYQSHLDTQCKCGLSKNTRKGCKKCGCGLHNHCFEEWQGFI